MAVAAGAVAPLLVAATPAEAQQAACRARMAGQGSGMGIAGQGTQNARAAAARDWSTKVEARYGARYADFGKARDVRYDCRTGVLEVKCALSARPCR